MDQSDKENLGHTYTQLYRWYITPVRDDGSHDYHFPTIYGYDNDGQSIKFVFYGGRQIDNAFVVYDVNKHHYILDRDDISKEYRDLYGGWTHINMSTNPNY